MSSENGEYLNLAGSQGSCTTEAERKYLLENFNGHMKECNHILCISDFFITLTEIF